MILYVNEKSEIKDVNKTNNPNLMPLLVKDDEECNPFLRWSVAKICCYKVNVVNGAVMMMTPYVDSTLLAHIDQLGKQAEAATPWSQVKEASHGESEVTFDDVPEGVLTAFVKDSEGRYLDYTIDRVDGTVIVYFEPLDYAAEIKISIN